MCSRWRLPWERWRPDAEARLLFVERPQLHRHRAIPGIDIANTRQAKGEIDSCNVNQLKERLVAADRRHQQLRQLRLDPGRRQGRRSTRRTSTPTCRRSTSKPAKSSGRRTTNSRARARTASSSPKGKVFGDDQLGSLRPRPENRQGALVDETDPQRTAKASTWRRATTTALVYVSTVPDNTSAEYEPGGGSARSGRSTPRPARRSGTSTPCRKTSGATRKSTPAAASGTRPPSTARARCTSAPATRRRSRAPPAKPVGLEPARPQPLHRLDGQARRRRPARCEWYYQLTPHDIYDWDFQDPPILVKAGGKEMAIGAGKSGIVVAVDPKTGKPVWKTPVGKHNGHDDDGLSRCAAKTSKIKPGEVFPGAAGRRDRADGDRRQAALRAGRQPPDDGPLRLRNQRRTARRPAKSSRSTPPPARSSGTANSNSRPSARRRRSTTSSSRPRPTASSTRSKAESGGEVWQAALPAGTNAGVMVSGDMLLAPAGLPLAEGQKAKTGRLQTRRLREVSVARHRHRGGARATGALRDDQGWRARRAAQAPRRRRRRG